MFLRKIKDIRISNKQISIIREASISVEELERQISQVEYQPVKDSKDSIVERTSLPPFVQVFYYHFFSYLKVPTLDDCWNTYVNWLGGESFNHLQFTGKLYNSMEVKSRWNRTYPSLIRDLHFLYLIDESKKFDSVDYSMEKDYYNGLDLRIVKNHTEVFVSLFLDTTRSRYFKTKKTERHDYSKVHEVEFNIDFSTMKKVGNIYLLKNEHVDILEKRIHEAIK